MSSKDDSMSVYSAIGCLGIVLGVLTACGFCWRVNHLFETERLQTPETCWGSLLALFVFISGWLIVATTVIILFEWVGSKFDPEGARRSHERIRSKPSKPGFRERLKRVRLLPEIWVETTGRDWDREDED